MGAREKCSAEDADLAQARRSFRRANLRATVLLSNNCRARLGRLFPPWRASRAAPGIVLELYARPVVLELSTALIVDAGQFYHNQNSDNYLTTIQ